MAKWSDTLALLKIRLFGLTDRKSTRLNSSHDQISYAVFCLKKKKNGERTPSNNHPCIRVNPARRGDLEQNNVSLLIIADIIVGVTTGSLDGGREVSGEPQP